MVVYSGSNTDCKSSEPLKTLVIYVMLYSGVNLVLNLGVVEPGQNISIFYENFKKISILSVYLKKKIDFSGQISEKFQFVQVISHKISTFQCKFPKNFDFCRQYSDFLGKFPKNFDFFRKFEKNFDFQAISQKNPFFRKISQKFRFCFRQFHKKIENLRKISMFFQVILYKIPIFNGKFTTNIDFPGKNWLFTAISGPIILFLFKSHHLGTYFLYMIRYNNILRPANDPSCDPPAQNLGSRDPQPPELTPMMLC